MSIYDNKTKNKYLGVENIFFKDNFIIIFRLTSQDKIVGFFYPMSTNNNKTTNTQITNTQRVDNIYF